MNDHTDFINANEQDAYYAILDRLGVKVTPAGPVPSEAW